MDQVSQSASDMHEKLFSTLDMKNVSWQFLSRWRSASTAPPFVRKFQQAYQNTSHLTNPPIILRLYPEKAIKNYHKLLMLRKYSKCFLRLWHTVFPRSTMCGVSVWIPKIRVLDVWHGWSDSVNSFEGVCNHRDGLSWTDYLPCLLSPS